MDDWKAYADKGKRMLSEESDQFKQTLQDGLALPKITRSAFDGITANLKGFFKARPPSGLSNIELATQVASGKEATFEDSFSANLKGNLGVGYNDRK